MDKLAIGTLSEDQILRLKLHNENIEYRKLELKRLQINDKTEQMKTISEIAALLAGFAVMVLVEIQVSDNAPNAIVATFCCTSAITVCLLCLSFMTCALMLVGVLKASELEHNRMSFQQFWVLRCEEDWMRALLLFSIGVPMFMVNLSLAGWIKYWEYFPGAISISSICGLALIVWVQLHLKWGSYLSKKVTYDTNTKNNRASRSTHEFGNVLPNNGFEEDFLDDPKGSVNNLNEKIF